MSELDRESMGRVERRLDEIAQAVGDVRERLARMEGAALHNAVEEIKAEQISDRARLMALEAAHNQSIGMMSSSKTWGEWVHRLAPWLFAAALVAWNYVKPPI